MANGAPVVIKGTDGHDFDFSWTNGTIAATLPQAVAGAQTMLKSQLQSGEVNPGTFIKFSPDHSFLLHVNMTVRVLFFSQDVVVNGNGNLMASPDGKSTIFSLMNGTLDAGGNGSIDQVQSRLMALVADWEAQAQREPLTRPPKDIS